MIDNSIINPYIRVSMNSVLKKGLIITKRIIFDYELIYIADGKFTLNYNGVDYKCGKGQFIFLCPCIPHSFSNINSNLTQPHIHFDITHMPDSKEVPVCFKDYKDLTSEEKIKIRKNIFNKYPKNPLITFSNKDSALQLFNKIIFEQQSALAQKGQLIQLLDMLIADNFPGLFKENNSEKNIEMHLKNYFDAGQGMSSNLEDIAHQFNYSKFHLERRFKNRYGVSLISYRNNKRMQLAKTLLLNESITNVCEKLGYSSIYVFSRAFKNQFGISPSEYKKSGINL